MLQDVLDVVLMILKLVQDVWKVPSSIHQIIANLVLINVKLALVMLLVVVAALQDSFTPLLNAPYALKIVLNALILQLVLNVLKDSQLQPQISAEDVQ